MTATKRTTQGYLPAGGFLNKFSRSPQRPAGEHKHCRRWLRKLLSGV